MLRLVLSLLLLAGLAASGTAIADDAGNRHLSGNWGGFRTDLEQSGEPSEAQHR
jgi:hypothetical protein